MQFAISLTAISSSMAMLKTLCLQQILVKTLAYRFPLLLKWN